MVERLGEYTFSIEFSDVGVACMGISGICL